MAIEFGTENPIKEKTLQSVINCQALDKTFFLLAGRSSSRASLNAPYWCKGDEISLLLLAVWITSGLDRDADSHSIAGHRLGLSHFPEVKPTCLHLSSNFPLWRRVRVVNMTSLCPVPGFLLQVVACSGWPQFLCAVCSGLCWSLLTNPGKIVFWRVDGKARWGRKHTVPFRGSPVTAFLCV